MKRTLGIADEAFIRGDIPMTKREIRVLALNEAGIEPDDIILDVGAGTGSLSIEAAQLAPQGHVYAIEREPEGIALIEANAAKFAVDNVTTICGSAPAALPRLNACNVILVGGSGGNLPAILEQCSQLLVPGGRLIITAVTVETLYTALHEMQERSNFRVSAFGTQITRIRTLKKTNMFQALNQIYIITCTKTGN